MEPDRRKACKLEQWPEVRPKKLPSVNGATQPCREDQIAFNPRRASGKTLLQLRSAMTAQRRNDARLDEDLPSAARRLGFDEFKTSIRAKHWS
jgi:hypothetical protein